MNSIIPPMNCRWSQGFVFYVDIPRGDVHCNIGSRIIFDSLVKGRAPRIGNFPGEWTSTKKIDVQSLLLVCFFSFYFFAVLIMFS